MATTVAEPLLSKRRKVIITDQLNMSNPVTVQVLGICSSLAVTSKLEPTIVMAISVLFVLVASNGMVSLIRDYIPSRIRIIVQLGVVATFVIVVDQVLRAYYYDIAKIVGVYVGLIITNCIIMGRLEAYAMANKPYDSILDGISAALGYGWVLIGVAFVRELFGSGSLFGVKVFELLGINNFPANGLMSSPVGAFFVIGFLIWIQRAKNGYAEAN